MSPRQRGDRTEPGWSGKSPTGTPWSPETISIGSRDVSDSPLPMDGPNVRPEPGYSPELNQGPQPADTPTIKTPEAISFRQLAALRQSAIEAGRTSSPSEGSADPLSTQLQGPSPSPGLHHLGQPQTPGAELAELDQLLGAYDQLGQRLLQQLSRQGSALEQHRHPQQVMALGALGAHIRLGLQALAASRQ